MPKSPLPALDRRNMALYTAKSQGGDRTVLYRSGDQTAA